MSLTSVQHGGFGDADGGVPVLVSEAGRDLFLSLLEVKVDLPVSVLLSMFAVQSLLKQSSMYFSRWSRSLGDVIQ